MKRRAQLGVLFAALFALAAMLLGILEGTEPISLVRAWTNEGVFERGLLLGVRAPRVLLAAIAGAGLAVVGAAFQGVLRNPLAEPYILGVSGGAALGATLAIACGASAVGIAGASAVPFAALLGGLVSTAVVVVLARRASRSGGASMLLAGVVVNQIALAVMTLVRSTMSASEGQALLYWLMGFIDVPSATTLATVSVYVAIGFIALLRDAGRVNLLALGDESAARLGLDVRALDARVLVACSCILGAIVSVTGLIGFVGLVVPHVLRRAVGPDARVLFPACFFGGAGLLVLCDLSGRILFRFIHTEPPVGAITALLGGPLFLALLMRRAPHGT